MWKTLLLCPKHYFFCPNSNFTPKIKTGSCNQVYRVNDLVVEIKIEKRRSKPKKIQPNFLRRGQNNQRIRRRKEEGGKEEAKMGDHSKVVLLVSDPGSPIISSGKRRRRKWGGGGGRKMNSRVTECRNRSLHIFGYVWSADAANAKGAHSGAKVCTLCTIALDRTQQ